MRIDVAHDSFPVRSNSQQAERQGDDAYVQASSAQVCTERIFGGECFVGKDEGVIAGMLNFELRSQSIEHQMPGAKSEAIVDATPKLAVRKGDLLRARHHLQGPRPRERSHRCHVQSSEADVRVLSVHLTLVRLHKATDLRTHAAGVTAKPWCLC